MGGRRKQQKDRSKKPTEIIASKRTEK